MQFKKWLKRAVIVTAVGVGALAAFGYVFGEDDPERAWERAMIADAQSIYTLTAGEMLIMLCMAAGAILFVCWALPRAIRYYADGFGYQSREARLRKMPPEQRPLPRRYR